MARPRIPVKKETLDQIKELAAICCTQDEAARVLGISSRTLKRWLANKRIREIWERGQALGKMSLRRAQFQAALAGNSTMLVWLGKVILCQSEPT